MASPRHFQIVEGVEPAGRSSLAGFYHHWFLIGETRGLVVERGHNPSRSDCARPAQMTANPPRVRGGLCHSYLQEMQIVEVHVRDY